MSDLLEGMFSTEPVSAVLDDRALLQAMLDFEAALAHALADCAIVPIAAAAVIAAHCTIERVTLDGLGREAGTAGNLAIPLVKRLTASVAAEDPEAAKFVHWGATSQDVIDTATVLQLRAASRSIAATLAALETALAALARRHGDTVMPGRTWLQHALPISFGLKAAGWLSGVQAAHRGFAESVDRASLLQFGGAAGTLASLGVNGLAVSHRLAERLGLDLPPAPWHGNRVMVASVAACLGILCGTLGKLARDISLLMQTEIGEAAEPSAPGKGGSSTMPHKRNPVGCAIALAAAIQAPPLVATMLAAMPQEHERGLGGWHAEWQTLPALLRLAAASAEQMRIAVAGLEVDAERMRCNLDQTRGLLMAEAVSMALAESIGKSKAHHLVETASRATIRSGGSLRDTLATMTEVRVHLSIERLDALMRPEASLGMAEHFIERILGAQQKVVG